jgi:hypothetical protein
MLAQHHRARKDFISKKKKIVSRYRNLEKTDETREIH